MIHELSSQCVGSILSNEVEKLSNFWEYIYLEGFYTILALAINSLYFPHIQANGVMISGMRVGLAEWDPNKGLIRTTKKQQYNPMPDIVCYPVENCSEGSTTPGHWFPCPLYASSEKKKFLCYITLKTFEQPDHLSLMGTTLIL